MPVSTPAQHDALATAGAGLGEVGAEGAETPRPSLKTRLKRHRGLALGAGVLALGAVAVVLSRGRVLRAARPLIAGAVRPMVARAVLRRPGAALAQAIQRPKAAARLVASLR